MAFNLPLLLPYYAMLAFIVAYLLSNECSPFYQGLELNFKKMIQTKGAEFNNFDPFQFPIVPIFAHSLNFPIPFADLLMLIEGRGKWANDGDAWLPFPHWTQRLLDNKWPLADGAEMLWPLE